MRNLQPCDYLVGVALDSCIHESMVLSLQESPTQRENRRMALVGQSRKERKCRTWSRCHTNWLQVSATDDSRVSCF
jgi:hypothetical protein